MRTHNFLAKIKHNELSDEEVVQLYLSTQREEYFDILYNKYSAKVYAKCISLLKSEVDAMDAVQEIFIKILLTLSRFSGRSKLSTWIYAISYNYCIDQVRKRQKSRVSLDEKIESRDIVDDIDDAVIKETNLQRLKVVLEEMNIMDKSILLMKYQDSMSIQDISEAFDKSESAIKMQIKRAKEKYLKIYNSKYTD